MVGRPGHQAADSARHQQQAATGMALGSSNKQQLNRQPRCR
jgi:hypothetical protein